MVHEIHEFTSNVKKMSGSDVTDTLGCTHDCFFMCILEHWSDHTVTFPWCQQAGTTSASKLALEQTHLFAHRSVKLDCSEAECSTTLLHTTTTATTTTTLTITTNLRTMTPSLADSLYGVRLSTCHDPGLSMTYPSYPFY